MPLGVPLHSWQAVASCGSSIGLKAMLFMSKTLALTVLDLLRDPELLRAARREFVHSTEGKPYKCPIPDELKPSATRLTEVV
jgi:aminobenzoyl-glutamate utilization protein B